MLVRFLLLFALAVSAALGSSTTTGDLSLTKPDDGETSWGEAVRTNFDVIDAQVTDVNKLTFKAEASFGAADATPTVAAGGLFATGGSSVSITDFDDPEDNQIILVRFIDSTTTIVDGSGIETSSNANITPTTGSIVAYYYDGTDWIEWSQSTPLPSLSPTPFGLSSSGASSLGDGSDGAGPTTTGNLDDGTGKNYTVWAVGASQTITLTDTDGIGLFSVQGKLSIGSGGSITGVGTGLAGGASGENNGTSSVLNPGGSTGGGAAMASGCSSGNGGGVLGISGGADDCGVSAPNNGSDGTDALDDTAQPLWWSGLSGYGPSPGGGGSTTQAGGAGGPLLVFNVYEFDSSGTINASGAGGTCASSVDGSGSGAGGTIVVYTKILTNSGTLTAAGGTAATCSGGGGGDGGDGRTVIVVVGD